MRIDISCRLNLEQTLRSMPKKERIDFLKEKIEEYKSGPEGCAKYITECILVPKVGVGYDLLDIWDIQIDMITDIVEFLFDPKKEMYIINGSRQCGKTTVLQGICDWLLTFFPNYAISLIHADEKRGGVTCGELREMASRKCAVFRQKYVKNQLQHQIRANNSSFMLQPTQKSKKGNVDAGRGMKAALLWIDEAAFVDIEKLEESIFPITSTTFQFCKKANIPHGIILTSTPNGRQGIGKKYFELWKAFTSGDPYIGGFKLYWRDIPIKDDAWFEAQCAKQGYNMRKINQEFELVFYGGENSLFTDETIAKIQNRIKEVSTTNYVDNTIVGTFTTMTFKQFIPIQENRNYLIGVDNSQGIGSDYSVVEVYDYDTMEQVMEVRNNYSQTEDISDMIHSITNTILSKGAKCIILIEANIGRPIITNLQAKDPMYRVLIMRDTIGTDNSKKKTSKLEDYSKCAYGIVNTTVTRPLLIGSMFYNVEKNLHLIHSSFLLNEIESLQEKDGKVEGHPHDDTVFASAYCWMVKQYGRPSILRNIFESCKDFNPNSNNVIDQTKIEKLFMDDLPEAYTESAFLNTINTMGVERIQTSIGTIGGIPGSDDSTDMSLQFLEARQLVNQHMMMMKSLNKKTAEIDKNIKAINDMPSSFEYLEKERSGKLNRDEEDRLYGEIV